MNYLRRLPKLEYLEPKTIEEACSLLSQYKEKARVVAGGTDLLPMMKRREVVAQYLIGLKSIPDLDYIRYDESDGLRFGALTTIHAIETSAVIKEKFNALSEAVYSMASAQVRNLGTVVGNLCSAVPSADTAPALIVLGAELRLVSHQGERTVSVEEFFTAPRETVLGEGEVLMEVKVPNLPPHSGSAYLKHTLRRAMDLAIVGVAAVITSEDGACKDVRIALGAVAPTPIRARKTEEMLRDKMVTDDLIEQVAIQASEESHPISDIRSSAEYRREMVKVLTRRAVKQAWEQAR